MAKYTANGVQVIMRYTDGVNIYLNTYNVDNTTPATHADLVNIISVFNTWEASTASQYRCPEVALYEIEAQALDNASAPRVAQPIEPPISGSLADTILPANVTLAVRFEGADARKAETGRAYWIGLGKGQYVKNEANGSARDNIVDAMRELGNALIAIGKFLVVLSKVIGKVSRPTNIMSPVVTFSADLALDSQRRRLDGRGR